MQIRIQLHIPVEYVDNLSVDCQNEIITYLSNYGYRYAQIAQPAPTERWIYFDNPIFPLSAPTDELIHVLRNTITEIILTSFI